MSNQQISTRLYNCIAISVPGPDGGMRIIVDEIDNDDHTPVAIHIFIGKAGTSIRAWSSAIEHLITAMLSSGTFDISSIAALLGNLTSDKWITLTNGSVVKSSPQAIAFALYKYNAYRQEHYNNALGHGSIRQG